MVVTPKLFASTTSCSVVKAKKNRRKIIRKNPTQSHPSSSQHLHNEDEDTDMNLSTLAAAGSSSLEAEAEPTIIITANADDEQMIDADPTVLSLDASSSALAFPPVAPGAEKTTLKSEMRRIPMPPHRMTPLKKDWLSIFGPLTEILGLQVRMNVQRRCVEIRVCLTPFPPKSQKVFEDLSKFPFFFRPRSKLKILELFKKVQILSRHTLLALMST